MSEACSTIKMLDKYLKTSWTLGNKLQVLLTGFINVVKSSLTLRAQAASENVECVAPHKILATSFNLIICSNTLLITIVMNLLRLVFFMYFFNISPITEQ